MEFEVIDIENNPKTDSFKVEIEIVDTRERKFYCYPNGDGWDKEVNGVPRFLSDIDQKLTNMSNQTKINAETKALKKSLSNIKSKKFTVSNIKMEE